MTEHQRNVGIQAGQWSRQRRSTIGGGTVPIEWRAQTIDLDALLVDIDGQPYLVGVAGRLWVEYDKVPFRLFGVVETKNVGEHRGAYVTYELARMADLDGYCVTLHDDKVVAEKHDGEVREFASVSEFVKAAHVLKRKAS